MVSKNQQLAIECKRLSEGCLYSSTSLFIWLRFVWWARVFGIIVPLVLGSIAGWNMLKTSQSHFVQVTMSLFAFLAGLIPTVYAALKLDDHLEACKHLAGEFKNLQDR